MATELKAQEIFKIVPKEELSKEERDKLEFKEKDEKEIN
jgi:hypothetical protein